MKKFEYFHITCIPREENKKADTLSELASPSNNLIHTEEVNATSIIEALMGYVDEVEDN